MDAPTFSNDTNIGTAYIETNTGATACNTPGVTNCFNGYLELQVLLQNRWTNNGRSDAPMSITADGTRYWWKAVGTCTTLVPGGFSALYRTYFQQSYTDQGSLVLHEKQWSTAIEHACLV